MTTGNGESTASVPRSTVQAVPDAKTLELARAAGLRVCATRRDLALEVGRFGRAASLYNILSRCDAFGLSQEEAQALVDGMLEVVRGWREFFIQRGVEQRSVGMLEHAMLPPSFFRDTPPDAI